MTTTFHAAGVTYQGFATEPPVASIGPGLLHLSILGTARDGLSLTNRVVGGATPTLLGAGPTFQPGFGTVNAGTGVNTPTGIDTQVVETTAIIASGWTMFCVGRQNLTTPGQLPSLVGFGSTGTVQIFLNTIDNSFGGSNPTVAFSVFGLTFAPVTDCRFILPGLISVMRFYALTFSGGPNGTYTLYDITDGITKVAVTTQTRPNSLATTRFSIGYNNYPQLAAAFADIFAAGFASAPWNVAQLTAMRNWLRGVATLRGAINNF